MDNSSKYTILIIDDEPNNITVVTEILEADYLVYAVIDSLEAIEVVEDTSPDLILLDIIMPDKDGYEIITELKSSKSSCDIPVIFITGLDSIDAEEKGFALGAADYISKPFHPAIVKIRVQNQIKLLEKIRQQESLINVIKSLGGLVSIMISRILQKEA